MKLTKYNLTLQRLREEDIELIRQWRNSKQVSQYMEYREYITAEMQKKWFKSINNPDNFFYLIIYKGEKIGMINEKGYDRYGKQTSESGLFLKDNKYYNTPAPVLASLILIEMNFYFLNGKESYIRILKDNHSSISYNKSLGYELCPGQEYIENQQYVLTRKSFEKKTLKLRKAAIRLAGGDSTFYLVWEPHDYESGIAQESEKLVENYPVKINSRWENGCRIFSYETNPEKPQIIPEDIDIRTPVYNTEKNKDEPKNH